MSHELLCGLFMPRCLLFSVWMTFTQQEVHPMGENTLCHFELHQRSGALCSMRLPLEFPRLLPIGPRQQFQACDTDDNERYSLPSPSDDVRRSASQTPATQRTSRCLATPVVTYRRDIQLRQSRSSRIHSKHVTRETLQRKTTNTCKPRAHTSKRM